GGELRFDESFSEATPHPHHFASGLHFGAKNRIDPRKLHKWEDCFFDRVILRHDLAHHTLTGKTLPRHTAGGDLGQRQAASLGDERHGTRGARVYLQYIHGRIVALALNSELYVHQTTYVEPLGHGLGL